MLNRNEGTAAGEGTTDEEGFNVKEFMERQKEIISKIKQENIKRQEAAANQMKADLHMLETSHATEMAALQQTHE